MPRGPPPRPRAGSFTRARSILIGAHTPEQVTSNVADFHRPIPEALWRELDVIGAP
ncbi:hypothetical protein AB0B45_01380 [Nonomuraea sp. NPDC049152]|uniref:hypothetical protein n=1 Tax=Nonomuraea sp. NPDC049152 TaxID=3154350 RepID=UPI0033C003C7